MTNRCTCGAIWAGMDGRRIKPCAFQIQLLRTMRSFLCWVFQHWPLGGMRAQTEQAVGKVKRCETMLFQTFGQKMAGHKLTSESPEGFSLGGVRDQRQSGSRWGDKCTQGVEEVIRFRHPRYRTTLAWQVRLDAQAAPLEISQLILSKRERNSISSVLSLVQQKQTHIEAQKVPWARQPDACAGWPSPRDQSRSFS